MIKYADGHGGLMPVSLLPTAVRSSPSRVPISLPGLATPSRDDDSVTSPLPRVSPAHKDWSASHRHKILPPSHVFTTSTSDEDDISELSWSSSSAASSSRVLRGVPFKRTRKRAQQKTSSDMSSQGSRSSEWRRGYGDPSELPKYITEATPGTEGSDFEAAHLVRLSPIGHTYVSYFKRASPFVSYLSEGKMTAEEEGRLRKEAAEAMQRAEHLEDQLEELKRLFLDYHTKTAAKAVERAASRSVDAWKSSAASNASMSGKAQAAEDVGDGGGKGEDSSGHRSAKSDDGDDDGDDDDLRTVLRNNIVLRLKLAAQANSMPLRDKLLSRRASESIGFLEQEDEHSQLEREISQLEKSFEASGAASRSQVPAALSSLLVSGLADGDSDSAVAIRAAMAHIKDLSNRLATNEARVAMTDISAEISDGSFGSKPRRSMVRASYERGGFEARGLGAGGGEFATGDGLGAGSEGSGAAGTRTSDMSGYGRRTGERDDYGAKNRRMSGTGEGRRGVEAYGAAGYDCCSSGNGDDDEEDTRAMRSHIKDLMAERDSLREQVELLAETGGAFVNAVATSVANGKEVVKDYFTQNPRKVIIMPFLFKSGAVRTVAEGGAHGATAGAKSKKSSRGHGGGKSGDYGDDLDDSDGGGEDGFDEEVEKLPAKKMEKNFSKEWSKWQIKDDDETADDHEEGGRAPGKPLAKHRGHHGKHHSPPPLQASPLAKYMKWHPRDKKIAYDLRRTLGLAHDIIQKKAVQEVIDEREGKQASSVSHFFEVCISTSFPAPLFVAWPSVVQSLFLCISNKIFPFFNPHRITSSATLATLPSTICGSLCILWSNTKSGVTAAANSSP